MRILIACEYSGIVRDAFTAKGHDAWSCDLLPTESPGNHIQGDVLEILNDGWDMMIAFPPCTHLANAGGTHFEAKRKNGMQRGGLEFFATLMNSGIEKIALENPIGILGSRYILKWFPDLVKMGLPRKPDQVIQPFYFGDHVRKYTCLWLKGLPKLQWSSDDNLFMKKTAVVPQEPTNTMIRAGKYRTGTVRKIYWQDMLPKKDRAKNKSKTFPGIAKAMAEQWGNL